MPGKKNLKLSTFVEPDGRAKDSPWESAFKTLQANSNKRISFETTEGARFGGTTVTINDTIVETNAQVRDRVDFTTSDNHKA
jgi:hypothetical protein